jgi:periplasmic protein TonB
MPRDPRSTVAEPVSLADRVYRPRLAEGNDQVRRASRVISLPVTLLGYLVLGLFGWWIVRPASVLPAESPKSVVVDLGDQPDGEPPPVPVPAPAGGPPPGAIEKADAPPPPLPANPEVVPEQPPAELPSQDLSGVAFPSAPAGTLGGSAAGAGSGEVPGPGTGSGQGQRVVEYVFSQVEVRYQPKLEYPPLAQRAGIQGTVKVAILVGLDGVPISAKALEGPPLLRSFAESYALKWRFRPSLENGVPVVASFPLTVQFRIR